MKKIIILSFLICSGKLYGQNPIPNPGFENWQYTAIWTIEADGWWSNNSEVAAWNVIPDSLPYDGNLALHLANLSYRGSIFTGFPITVRPDYLSGYVKNDMPHLSEAVIKIVLYNAGLGVDSGSFVFFGGPIINNWEPFHVAISQTNSSADSAVITITGPSEPQSSILFDQLSFDGPAGISTPEEESIQIVYPNPVYGNLYIRYHDGTPYTVSLFDASGKLVDVLEESGNEFPSETFLPFHQVLVPEKSLEPGIYYVHIHSKIKSVMQRVVYLSR